MANVNRKSYIFYIFILTFSVIKSAKKKAHGHGWLMSFFLRTVFWISGALRLNLMLKHLILHVQHRHTVREPQLHHIGMAVGIIERVADDFIIRPGVVSHVSLPFQIPHEAVVAWAE